jgi:hypothetical protein
MLSIGLWDQFFEDRLAMLQPATKDCLFGCCDTRRICQLANSPSIATKVPTTKKFDLIVKIWLL